MRQQCIGIYGDTCSGKSTLGRYLATQLGCRYVSFGDAKRKEIATRTATGRSIQDLTNRDHPIDPELGYSLLRNNLENETSIVSGYPICLEELATFSLHVSMVGIVSLSISEKIQFERFFARAICPICQFPGKVEEACPFHAVLLMKREDSTSNELLARKRLYSKRILPFLKSQETQHIPRITLDCTELYSSECMHDVVTWTTKAFSEQGGARWNQSLPNRH